MCWQGKNQAASGSNRAAAGSGDLKQDVKRAFGRPKYPGSHPCFWHDVLADLLKEPPDTLCRKCFTQIGRHQVQYIAHQLVQQELINRRLHNLDREIARANSTLDQLLKLEKEK